MRKIIITAALTGLLLATGGSTAQAVPISPKTCVRDGVQVPCVKYGWTAPAKAKRTWHGTPWQPTARTWSPR